MDSPGMNASLRSPTQQLYHVPNIRVPLSQTHTSRWKISQKPRDQPLEAKRAPSIRWCTALGAGFGVYQR